MAIKATFNRNNISEHSRMFAANVYKLILFENCPNYSSTSLKNTEDLNVLQREKWRRFSQTTIYPREIYQISIFAKFSLI